MLGLNLNLITDETKAPTTDYTKPHKQKINYSKVTWKVLYFSLIFGAAGTVFHYLTPWLNSANILMLYLLVMVVANKGRGRVSAIIAALVGTLSFDFFIVPPYFSFAISDSQYLITFSVLLVIGITFSVINGNLRFQLRKLSKLHMQAELFNQVNKHLAAAMIEMQVTSMLPDYFEQMFHAKLSLSSFYPTYKHY